MKLNKYLYKKFTQEHEEFVIPSEKWPFTEEDIEEWIIEWYKDVFGKTPPMWLTGKRWYDRRQQKIGSFSNIISSCHRFVIRIVIS